VVVFGLFERGEPYIEVDTVDGAVDDVDEPEDVVMLFPVGTLAEGAIEVEVRLSRVISFLGMKRLG
jgi:hypothetical protein